MILNLISGSLKKQKKSLLIYLRFVLAPTKNLKMNTKVNLEPILLEFT